ncbi:hypothetical protein [Caulobacter phage DCM]|uniref:Scaffolding protein n=1 Tax=Caulobacter phage DCM TaxID=3020391 RepID=A0AAE9WZE2_9CAUD|nr:hypothetical protein [Caulobacter phage DCM]WCD56119.1 scaffold protein [Caulobacter phage BL199]
MMADAVASATPETPAVETPPITLDIQATPPADPIAAAAAAAAEAAAKAGEQNPVPAKPLQEDPPEPVYTYAPTGDDGLDIALEFIGKIGIKEDNPAMQAAIKGDFTALRALCASMGDKAAGYERFVALGERAYKDATTAQTKLAADLKSAVVGVAGDEETWGKVLAWASKEATNEEKVKLNAMLTADPFQARAAAELIVGQYNKRVNAPMRQATKHDASGVNSGTAPSDQSPLNRREYAAAVVALNRRLGDRMQNSPEYKALQQRHLAYGRA